MLKSLLRTDHNSAQSRKAKCHKVMANVLDDLIQKAQDNRVYIQANNLATITPLWKQQLLNEDNLTPILYNKYYGKYRKSHLGLNYFR